MPFYDKAQSKLKMVALMPHNEANVTWYSPVWQNKKPNAEIMRGMLNRFSKQLAAKRSLVIQFYENDVLIHEIKRP